MPKISLFHPEKSENFKFIDKQISRMFTMGGTDGYLHKLMGTKSPTTGRPDQPIYVTDSVTNIQDLLLLENRDRKYDPEIYHLRLFYNVKDVDFNLSQFGLFIDSDTLYMTVHINDFINIVGRKPLCGDVIELPHLKDDYALNDFDISLPRYYVIDEVGRASEGFSVTWFPHLYRLRTTKITDSQEFSDILNLPASEGSDLTIGEVLSTKTRELAINDAILNQAESDVRLSGYETRQFYTLKADPKNEHNILHILHDYVPKDPSPKPLRAGYTGYLLGDGFPVNGYMFGSGSLFPVSPNENDYYLRTDFLPNRLYRFAGTSWVKVEDSVRMTLTNDDNRQTLKTSFINNLSNTYNNPVGDDVKKLTQGDIIINTNIIYSPALYVVIRLDLISFDYDVATYPSMLSSYSDGGVNKVRITLPMINNTQQVIPQTGMWNIKLYNHRDIQKQSLSEALKPQADF